VTHGDRTLHNAETAVRGRGRRRRLGAGREPAAARAGARDARARRGRRTQREGEGEGDRGQPRGHRGPGTADATTRASRHPDSPANARRRWSTRARMLPPRYPRSPPTPTPGQCRVRGAVRGRDTGAFAPPRAARLLYDMKSHSDIRCHFMGRARVTFPTCRRPPAHSAARGTAGLTCSARHHRSGEAGKLGCSRRGSGAQRQRGR
jgi:hypothetical protein